MYLLCLCNYRNRETGDRLTLTYEYTVCGFVKLTVGSQRTSTVSCVYSSDLFLRKACCFGNAHLTCSNKNTIFKYFLNDNDVTKQIKVPCSVMNEIKFYRPLL